MHTKTGYTTKSGIIKPLLLNMHALVKASGASEIVSTENLKVIPVCMASDGTAIKPGLEFDAHQKKIVGATINIDCEYVKAHVEPDLEELKQAMVTEVDVTFLTTLDNKVAFPVGVYYLTKKGSGEERYTQFSNMICTVQTCTTCLAAATAEQHILGHTQCYSYCQHCFTLKAVCDECQLLGHTSYIPQLKRCNQCVKDNVPCYKFAVIFLTSDCEEKNKKALERFQKSFEAETIQPEALLLCAIPDAVHLGKTFKCSWSNWFILVDGSRTCLAMVRTLRDFARPEIKKKLRKLLTLECVRNRDRMSVEPILRLASPEVVHQIEVAEYVIHTLVPETYKLWKSNMPGVVVHPVDICIGSTGKLLIVDRGEDENSGTLVEVRLHYPADIHVLATKLSSPSSVTYLDGVAYIAEKSANCITYFDLANKVKLKVSKLSRAELVMQLEARNMPTDGYKKDLQHRLQEYLNRHMENVDNIVVHVQSPVAIASFQDADVLYLMYCDQGSRKIHCACISYTGISIEANIQFSVNYPANSFTIRSLAVFKNQIAVSTSGQTKGIHIYVKHPEHLEYSTHAIQNAETGGVAFLADNEYVFADLTSRKVKHGDLDGNVLDEIGSGLRLSSDGCKLSACFVQPLGICTEGKTVYVTDAATGKVKMISPVLGTTNLLLNLAKLYLTFGVHRKGTDRSGENLNTGCDHMTEVDNFIQSHVSCARNVQHLPDTAHTNGPQGTISQKTQISMKLMLHGLRKCQNQNDFPYLDIDLASLITSAVENIHAVSRMKHETFSTLEYAQDFGHIIKESLKRSTKWAAQYYTSVKSYYPIPANGAHFKDLDVMAPLPTAYCSPEDARRMKEWIEPFRPVRQRTVRQETTKDKAGTLPIALYRNDQRANVVEEIIIEDNVDAGDAHASEPEEYDTDTDTESESEEPTNNEEERRPMFTRSGRMIKVVMRMDL